LSGKSIILLGFLLFTDKIIFPPGSSSKYNPERE